MTTNTDFSESVEFKHGRYEVRLPWKETHPDLPTNHHLCHQRLRGLLHRLKQNKDLLIKYDALIKEQVTTGIVDVVHSKTEDQSHDVVHYIPHHPVFRPDKETTKIRVVYDASARGTGPSLNDCLYSGPKFDQ